MRGLRQSVPSRTSNHRAGLGPLAALAMLLLAGCAGFEPLAEPDLATPAHYVDTAAKPGVLLPLEWPSVFGSTELTRLVHDAKIDNLDIAVAGARILQAEAQAGIAGSGLYPQISGDANASTSLNPGTLQRPDPPFHSSISHSYSLGLSASYTLDIWGKNAATLEAARQSAVQAHYQRDVTTLATVAAVVNAYFDVLAAEDRIAIARDNVRTADRVLAAIRGRLSVGTATALDVAQEESVVATQRASIPPLEQEIAQQKAALAVLLGIPPVALTLKGGSLAAVKVPRIAPGIPSELLGRRPDIAAAESGLKSARANVAAARAAFFPSIDLSARGGLESMALKTLFRPDAEFYQLTAGLTQPIFDGFNLENQLANQRGLYIELLQTYKKAIISAFSDVESALVAVRKTSEHLRLQMAVVEASRRAYQISEQRLREGTIDIVTLSQTQSTLFQAQDQLVQIRLQRLQAVVSLYQALGGGWTRQDIAASAPGDGK
ncbi:MAG: efflux transporter outer membrane subunit [Ancalomicrobiaceae bacterium]|nr:efflux transporter outer membrane subunit [Ancalomicrobiaceae bacterium]